MAQQTINRGTVAGDGTGESLFSAFGKVNANFSELYTGISAEAIQDIVGAFVTAGANVTVTYDDAGNTLSLAVPNEAIDDRVAALLIAGQNVTLTYDDAGNTLTISGSAAKPSTIQVFSASATYTKPAGVKILYIIAVGGGAGGGSGRRGAAGSARSGGAAGAGGGWSDRTIDASLVGATETVTIGAAGVGGAAVSTDDTNGNIGTNGGNSSFGSWVMANGGTAHPTAAAVVALSATGAAPGSGGVLGGNGGGTAVTGTQATAPVRALGVAPGGGGGGASYTTADARVNGQAGAAPGTGAPASGGGAYTATAAGGVGAPITNGDTEGGGGGAGGGLTVGGVGFVGGAGGFPGGGGGGGGAALNTFASGAGANGAAGYVIVFESY